MTGPLVGHIAMITGAGSEVGRAAAVRFAWAGAHVVGVDASHQALDALRADMPGEASLTALQADVGEELQVRECVATAMATHGRIDSFFNNVGADPLCPEALLPLQQTSAKAFRDTLTANARAAFLGLKHVVPVMAAAGGGAIVNRSSVYGLKGTPDQMAYVASKHAIRAMTISAAREWAAKGVRVNAIAPGAIGGSGRSDVATRLQVAAGESPDPRSPQTLPLSRWGRPEDIGAIVIFLCSNEAKYITGACFSVDGGLHAV